MNECFGGNYTHYFNDPVKEVYGGFVWFPKERIRDRSGDWQSGSKEVNWKNYVTDDGEMIYMYLNPGETIKDAVKERPEKPKTASPCHVFMKSEKYDGYYKYEGTFLCDLNISTGDTRISRRLKSEIDLSIWHDNMNDGYYEVEGNPAFSDFYLFGSYKKQKDKTSSFDYKSIGEEYLNNTREFTNEYSIAKIARLGENAFKGEYLAALINVIENVFGEKLILRDLFPSNMDFPEVGMAYYHLLTLSYESNHNSELKNSILPDKIAGMVMAVYDPYYYIYGLNDEEIDLCLKKVGLESYIGADRIERINILYFWKQCMCDLDEWSIPAYISFIKTI